MNLALKPVLYIGFVLLSAHAQEELLVSESISPLYFETMKYPLAARLTHVQGIVVVQAKVDEHGKVIAATALFGARKLVEASLENSKKWKFRPSSPKMTIIVYRFRIEGLCNPPCSSHFTFEPPNFAVITIGEPVVDHTGN